MKLIDDEEYLIIAAISELEMVGCQIKSQTIRSDDKRYLLLKQSFARRQVSSILLCWLGGKVLDKTLDQLSKEQIVLVIQIDIFLKSYMPSKRHQRTWIQKKLQSTGKSSPQTFFLSKDKLHTILKEVKAFCFS